MGSDLVPPSDFASLDEVRLVAVVVSFSMVVVLGKEEEMASCENLGNQKALDCAPMPRRVPECAHLGDSLQAAEHAT